MKQLTLCALVAAVVSLGLFWLRDSFERGDEEAAAVSRAASAAPVSMPAARSPALSGAPASTTSAGALSLRFTAALPEDTWVNASRQAGSDKRSLTSAKSSICFLTKIEISGIQGPADKNSCAIEVDDFTGFWQLIATADEGARSEVRCNARCLTWEPEGDEP